MQEPLKQEMLLLKLIRKRQDRRKRMEREENKGLEGDTNGRYKHQAN